MRLTAQVLAATVLGLASSAVQALTASPQQFTVTTKLTSYCMVATAAAGVELSKQRTGETDAYGDVFMVCSKGPSISSVQLEGDGPWDGSHQQPGVRFIGLRTRGANACMGTARLSTEFSGEPPLVVCASLRDRAPAATGEVSRKVRVTVTYD